MDSLSKSEAGAFVGKKSEYYLNMWDRYAGSASFKGWNCSALLFGILWVAYRKMYRIAAILLGIQVLAAIIRFVPLTLALLGRALPPYAAYPVIVLMNLVAAGVYVYCGIFGNKLYRDKAARALAEAGDIQEKDTQRRMDSIAEKGGVNDVIVILYALVVFALFLAGRAVR